MKYNITLDHIPALLNEIKAYQKSFDLRIQAFIQRMVDMGVKIAETEVLSLGAFDTGELFESIEGLIYTDGTRGIIFVDSEHAAFVEFGTGVQGADSPYPETIPVPWKYDANGYGEAGWMYFDETRQQWRRTNGLPSRPFLYNTAKELEARATQIAKEVLALN